jgi:BirA family biotin operon repressor/biotin-[acetyl-CoA-carboxylase] ligase
MSAVAVARAIEATTHLKPRIKWPNDVLVNGRKVAGLLNEMSAETDTIHWVVLGIGVNINMRRDQFPDGLRHPASSLLLEQGSPVDRAEFTRSLLSSLDSLYDGFLCRGFESVREEWLARATIQGQRVRVSTGDGDIEGTVIGIDADGALLLRRGDGDAHRILSGDVTIV